jgi:DtxR family Mn-dependent transcriptional regulator
MWECLLVGKLNLPWEKAHDYACQLEHATETAVTEALAAFLNHPTTCPHGNPTPGPDGIVAKLDDVALTAVQPGQSGTIQRIYPESTLLHDYLAGRDLKPGSAFTVREIAPFNGPIMVECCQQVHPLGQEIAAHIFVTIEAETE